MDTIADNSSLFRTMADRHTEALYSLALSRTSDRDDAWDLIQEAYERALRRKPNVADDRALRGWLTVVLHNLFIDRCRTAATRRAFVDLDELPTPEPEEVDQQCLWFNVSIETIERLGEELRPSARDIFRLHLKGLPVRVIATELGIPATKVSRKLFWARRKIRERISAIADAVTGEDASRRRASRSDPRGGPSVPARSHIRAARARNDRATTRSGDDASRGARQPRHIRAAGHSAPRRGAVGRHDRRG